MVPVCADGFNDLLVYALRYELLVTVCKVIIIIINKYIYLLRVGGVGGGGGLSFNASLVTELLKQVAKLEIR